MTIITQTPEPIGPIPRNICVPESGELLLVLALFLMLYGIFREKWSAVFMSILTVCFVLFRSL